MIICGRGANGVPPSQEDADQFYWEHGPCCAGCDFWEHLGTLVGDCLKSAPVSTSERTQMLGLANVSHGVASAGHVMTRRDHVCGDFRDEFDWSTLPLAYRKRIGADLKQGDKRDA